ncbi:MAG: site-2 protease family protein [Acidimicrobiales bacterium]|nr:site-2 protease family protein [Acidimicrobiales bacterium]
MKDSVRLGKIAGVRLGLHWSLLVMVGLVASGLAQNRFANQAPGLSGFAYGVAGALTAVGLLVGVLLHELAHAVVARRKGLVVDGITLSWMGGVTRIEGDTGTPGTELMVAGIGPVVSAAVGGLLLLIRLGVHPGGTASLAIASLDWLGWINLVLAVFNLLPASPLDGGKVLHALVWAAGRNRWRATQVASFTGVALGAATVAAGFVITERSQDVFDGLLIGFIGWWLLASARAELGSGAIRRALDGRRVSELMRPVGEAPGWITIRHFAEAYATSRPGWVWLLRDWNGGYSGVLLGDTVSSVPYPHWDLARPVDVALPISTTVGATPEEDALSVLTRTGGNQVILVVSDGHTVGAVLPGDIEALVRMGGRVVPGRRPATGPVG